MNLFKNIKGVLMPNAENKEAEGKIGEKQVQKAWEILLKYKRDKNQLEEKIVANEQWWKLRHWDNSGEKTTPSAWLWNVIVSKHADAMDAYPEPNLLPRAFDDEAEAKKLSSIIPVILEQNNFRQVYSDIQWYKLKQGTGIYGIFWDNTKHGGLGDITIKKVDGLSLFWEGGISDIQNSKHLFYATLTDTEDLEAQYPQYNGAFGGDRYVVARYLYDDNVDTTGKTTVVDWYYHEYNAEGKKILHYCKFAGSKVLFATENQPEQYPNGWYDHGMYPFVVDPLFTIEGSPFGYGYIDEGKGVQEQIDKLSHAAVTNALLAAKPRYFIRGDGAVNEEEFADWTKDFVHTNGNLGQDSILEIKVNLLNGNYLNLLESKINELKETSGNRDVNNGGSSAGATAASAIAAMQESGGKLSRDASAMSYEGFKLVVNQCIELIRQFYDLPRQFRITGAEGHNEFVSYDNTGIKPQAMQMNGMMTDLLRKPEFDIEVSAQKASVYSKMAQNELAIQLYNLGVFAPQNADNALSLLDIMDFNHKEDVIQRVKMNGDLQARLVQLGQFALTLANRYEPQAMNAIAQIIGLSGGGTTNAEFGMRNAELGSVDQLGGAKPEEHGRVQNARAQTQESVMPN